MMSLIRSRSDAKPPHAHPRRAARAPWRRIALLGSLTALAVALASGNVAAQPAAQADGAHRGYLAARLDDRGRLDVIDELHAGRLFVPASVLKLATAAAALEHLGAGYRWTTRLTSGGAVDGGVLDGDLIIEPGADPTWSGDGVGDEALAALAGQVRARGITRIAGGLVVNAGRFPGRRHPLDRDFGDLPYAHGTPAAALAVDDGTITVHVAPGEALGAPARARATDGIELVNLTTTVGRDRQGAGTLDFVPVWGTDTLVLRGEYPISEPPFDVAASDPAPARRAAQRLRRALVEAGVTLDGDLRLEAQPAAGRLPALAEWRSAPLAELLVPILTKSHNWYADMLVLTLGLEAAGNGRFTDGVDIVSEFLGELPDGGERAAPEPWLRDGSGLSPANLVTPAAIVDLLAHALRQPWGRTLADALATPGLGTLAAWPRLPPVAAKTGTLRHTVALAGILDPDSDTPVVFCYFVNHHPAQRAAARREIADALRRWRSATASR